MIQGVICDLDGTLYRGREAVPGAARFVGRWRQEAIRLVFVTNRANRTAETICEQLSGHGIACEPTDVLTSGLAAAQYLRKGSVYCVGEDAMRQTLAAAGFVLTEDQPDYVVVSLDQRFTYDKLRTACRLIRAGASFVATNRNLVLCTDQGVLPGTGAIVAAVAACAGVEPLVIGKPAPLIFRMAVARMRLAPEQVVVLGDNLDTDIRGGHDAGFRTALILTGVSRRQDLEHAAVKPTWVVASLEEFNDVIRRENDGEGDSK